MMTGRGPVNRGSGGYSTPEISTPSKLFHFTIDAPGSVSGFAPPISLNVHRSARPVDASTEYTSLNARAPARLKPTSFRVGCHDRSEMTPAGSIGLAFERPVESISSSWVVDP